MSLISVDTNIEPNYVVGDCKLLRYDMGNGVEAFSTMKDSPLPYPVVQAHQIHTDRIALITDPNTTRDQLEGIDAMITRLPNCAIGARTADCVPILLYDPEQRAVAAIHSGWRGTVLLISQQTIKRMQSEFGTRPEYLRAIIGPSIGVDAFQVGEEVVKAFDEAGFPMDEIYEYRGEHIAGDLHTGHHIDLWKANKVLLTEAGIRAENIQIAGICSYTQHDRFNSARWDKNNKTQRTITAIKLI